RTPGECIAGDPQPVIDVIRLRRGTYVLTLGGPDDDLNQGGDLDVTGSVRIEGKGRGSKIKSRIGSPSVAGDGDRLLHLDPGAAGGVDAVLVGLTITRGDVGCTGEGCTTGASAVEMSGPGSLVLEGCSVLRNAGTCSGAGCGDDLQGAAIRAVGGGALAIRRSRVTKNTTSCGDPRCAAGAAAIVMYRDEGAAVADFVLEEASVTKNSSTCFGERCVAAGTAIVTARTITTRTVDLAGNGAACVGVDCDARLLYGLFGGDGSTLEDVEISENDLRCSGDNCGTRSVLELQGGSGDAGLSRVGAAANEIACSGTACAIGAQLDVFGRDVRLDDVIVEATKSVCSGKDCIITSTLDVDARDDLLLRRLAMLGTITRCGGDGCATRGTILAAGTSVTAEEATLESNGVFCDGVGCRAGSVLDVDSDAETALVDTSVSHNLVSCIGDGCALLDVVDLFANTGRIDVLGSAVRGNVVGCTNDGCTARGGVNAAAPIEVVFDEAGIDANQLRCSGAGCVVEQLVRLASDDAELLRSVLESNESLCQGASCRSAAIALLSGDRSDVAASRLAANRSECNGTGCTVGLGGALQNAASFVSVSDTVFASNATDGFGAAIFNAPGSEIFLQRVTLEDNAAGLRGTIEFGGAGGAIYNDADDGVRGTLSVRNSVLRNNRASFGGGGIFNEGLIATFTGNQLTGNQPNDCTNFGGTGCP
ncbi:MAG: hypothetical protein AB1689_26835, partial [Thermodesulfobacteriota bacterium]